MIIKNFTGRLVSVYIDGEWQSFESEGKISLDYSFRSVEIGLGCDCKRVRYSIKVPDKSEGVLLLVDEIVALCLWRELRDDVVFLDKPLLYDDKNLGVASFGLVFWDNYFVG